MSNPSLFASISPPGGGGIGGGGGGDRSTTSSARPAPRPVTEVGLDQRVMFSALEAIATGRASFNTRALAEPTSQDGDTPGSSSANAFDSAKAAPPPTTTPSGGSAQLKASAQGSTKGSAQGDAEVVEGGAAVGVRGGIVGGAAGGKEPLSQEGPAAVKYRAARNIDSDIMSTVVAEVRPAPPGPGAVAVYDCGDTREVYGPEMEWELSVEPGREGDLAADAAARNLVKAVKGAGEEGLSLSRLRSAVGGGKEGDISALGHALRGGIVACLCDAEDVRWAGCLGWSLLYVCECVSFF